jgi:hypothetical protein
MMMALHRRLVGLAALVSFLAVAAWSAGFVPAACCNPGCDPCPIMFGKSAAAQSSPKVSIAAPALAPRVEANLMKPVSDAGRMSKRVCSFLPHEFQLPMRN